MDKFTPNPKFPQLCDGVTVGYDTKRGRYVQATRDLPLGTVVCVEEGITVNIDPKRCYRCLAELERADDVYCRTCPSFDEPEELGNGEFDELGIFKLAAHLVFYYDYDQIKKMLMEAEHGHATSAPGTLSTDDINAVLQLRPMPQMGEALSHPMLQKQIDKMVEALDEHQHWGKLETNIRQMFFCKSLRLMAERCAKNSHVVYGIEQTLRATNELPLGTGMFPIASLFNHSCAPNVSGFFVNNKFIFVSRGVKEGEELVDSYGVTHAQNTYLKRKDFLKNVSGFECHCEMCEEKMSMNVYLTTNLTDPQKLVEMSKKVKDMDDYLEYIEPGNKDIEVLIKLFAKLDDAKVDLEQMLKLWKMFVSNAAYRGIKFDEYLIQPYLHQLVILGDETIKHHSDEFPKVLETCDSLLETLYLGYHPAAKYIKNVKEAHEKKNDVDLKKKMEELEAFVDDLY